jgi:hypothetical protein
MNCERIDIAVTVWRQPGKERNVLICFTQGDGIEQKHLLSHDTEPISSDTIIECIGGLVTQIIDKSCYSDRHSARRALQRERLALENGVIHGG